MPALFPCLVPACSGCNELLIFLLEEVRKAQRAQGRSPRSVAGPAGVAAGLMRCFYQLPDVVLFCVGSHLADSRLTPDSGIIPGRPQTRWDAWDGTLVGNLQGKCLNSCTISLILPCCFFNVCFGVTPGGTQGLLPNGSEDC